MDEIRQSTILKPTLPSHARLTINRCNLPAVILGSLTFQQHPIALHIDGIATLHANLFSSLDTILKSADRAENFKDYMRSSFLLDNLDEAGFKSGMGNRQRERFDYLRLLRGWLFDSNSREAAVFKGWVESRFGLLPRNHFGPLGNFSSDNYQLYLSARSQGIYNTNAIESQLDLLFSYCQYEIHKRYPLQSHIYLYRGTNHIDEYEILAKLDKFHYQLLLNNLNSFTSQLERADEFGDYILEVKIPITKIVYMPDLLPGTLKGEDEYLVVGGVYEVEIKIF